MGRWFIVFLDYDPNVDDVVGRSFYICGMYASVGDAIYRRIQLECAIEQGNITEMLNLSDDEFPYMREENFNVYIYELEYGDITGSDCIIRNNVNNENLVEIEQEVPK